MDQGRDLCTDNWHTSLPLANSLLDRRMNLIGIIRKNRKGLPQAVTARKLKKGDVYFQQNNRDSSAEVQGASKLWRHKN